MKILFCSSTYLSKELGASKVLLELAEEMTLLGWQCKLVDPEEIAQNQERPTRRGWAQAEQLRGYLLRHAKDYHVVEYDHGYLPFPRGEFEKRTLFVARSVLLPHHFRNMRIPSHLGLIRRIRRLPQVRKERAARERWLRQTQKTVEEADLVNVSNERDRDTLVRSGLSAAKIVVLPCGLSRSRRPLFDRISEYPPAQATVAFIGTFDDRKGAADFPVILERIAQEVPDVRFRLLGTASIYTTAEQVIDKLPPNVRPRTEVVPRFAPDQLPSLLQDCSVGIFPSYLESFGLGVIEMLAAAIPVIAYDVPGPSEILPPQFLVRPGDAGGMAAKAAELLQSRDQLAAARLWARQRSSDFSWPEIARRTTEIYAQAWAARQDAHPSATYPAGLSLV